MLIVDLLGIEKLSNYKVDGIVINSIDYSIFSNTKFNYSEIVKINDYCKKNKILSIVSIDRILLENDLDKIIKFIILLEKIKIDYYIFSDLAIIDIFKEKKLLNKLIYKPNTLITNQIDAEYINSFEIGFFVSNEISLEDIQIISKKSNFCIEIYGYHPIFYSKRKSLRNFSEHHNNSNILKKTKYLKEELRDELYPIYENEDISLIFSPKKIALTKELNDLVNVKFFKINGDFILEKDLFKVIKVYNDFFNLKITDIELYDYLYEIDPDINNQFLYKKTQLLQSGDNDEKN